MLAMASCTEGGKTLVLYYSQTGATKAVAEEFAAQLGADIVSFDVEDPYSGTFDETIARCLSEKAAGTVPALAALDVDLAKYDVVFLGYPVWFGTYAPPVASLLKEVDLSGKVLVPFCTFGSGGLNTSSADLKAALPGADIREGYGVRNARVKAAPAEIEQFLIASSFKEGVKEVLPEFSEQAPVTEEDVAVFDAACSDYQMPLGSPVTVGKRERIDGTEYLFVAESAGADGQVATSKIYVIAPAGQTPQFTQVVR